MAGNTLRPTKSSFMFVDVSGQIKCVNRSRFIMLFWEEPVHRLVISKPVFCEDVQSSFWKDSVTVWAILAMRDMNSHVAAFDILISQMTDFAYSETCRIHERNHGFLLQIRNGRDEGFCFLLGRNIRQIFIEFKKWELCIVPRFMKDVHGKKAQLRNDRINGTVWKGTSVLNPLNKLTRFIPWNFFWGFMNDVS